MEYAHASELQRMQTTIRDIIRRKPFVLLALSVCYLIVVVVLKWKISPTFGTVFFMIGGLIGVYFLDIAETFFRLSPSPFRSILFVGLFELVSLFVITSSGSMVAIGLVFSLYLQLILWQIGEMKFKGNIDSWYTMIATPVSRSVQKLFLIVFCGFFLFLTYTFIR